MQHQIVRRECDNPNCGTKTDFPVSQMLTPTQEADISRWIVMSKEHFLISGEQPKPLSKIACCTSCAVEILRNSLLDLPKKPSSAN